MAANRYKTRHTMKIADLMQELGLSASQLAQILREVNIRVDEGQKNLDQQEAARVRQYLNEQRRREELKKQTIALPSIVKVQELAKRLELPVGEVLSVLLKNGVVANLNDDVDFETAAIVAAELGYATEERVEELEKDVLTPEKLEEILKKEDPKKQTDRPPVVTIMGHVDHGKCVHPDTTIPLDTGALKTAKQLWDEYAATGTTIASDNSAEEIVELADGPKVFSWNGEDFEARRISHIWRIRHTDPLVTLTLASGDEVTVTPEHPCLTLTAQGKMVYKQAGEIGENDYLVVPQTLSFGSISLKELKTAIIQKLAAAGNCVAFLNEEGVEQVISFMKKATKQQLLRENILTTPPSAKHPSRYRLADLRRLAIRFEIPLYDVYDWIDAIKNASEKWRAGHTSIRISLPRTEQEFAQLGYLIGVIIGDGHLDPHEVTIHNNDQEIQDASMQILKRIFRVTPLLADGHTAQMIRSGGGKTFVQFLHTVFEIPIGSKSGIVRIPSLVQQSRWMRTQAIAGIFDTDGYVSAHNHSAEFSSKSQGLMKDIAFLLLEQGIHSKIAEKNGYGLLRLANAPYLERFINYYPIRHQAKKERIRTAMTHSSTSRIFDATPLPGTMLGKEHIPEKVLPYFNTYKKYTNLSRRFLQILFRNHRDVFDRCFNTAPLKPLVNPGEMSVVKVINVDKAKKSKYVYDFSVPELKNFVAERMVIHNTTLLDSIRKTNVAAGEAGGITQAISSYQVEYKNRIITFIDTPGHETFEFMRKRGASLADVAILVVAADDGVKPQTKEAVKHAREAEVPIVVAINKVDKPGANIDKVKSELAELDLQPEEWGGKTVMVLVSALKKKGIDELLEMILLTADLTPPKAIVDRPALGSVVESRLDKNLGPLATVLIHTGTLATGDDVVIGRAAGRVRRLLDFQNKAVEAAGPSMPAVIVGLREVPRAGDILQVVEAKGEARLKAAQRRAPVKKVQKKDEDDERQTLALVIKADSQGSLEAIEQTITAMTPEDVRLSIIRSEVGNVSDSDVLTARAGEAIVYAFQTKIGGMAQKLADKEHVSVRFFDVIYRLSEDVRQEIEERLPVDIVREDLGKLKVLKVFFSTQKRKIVGGEVAEGKVVKGAQLIVLRREKGKSVPVGRGQILEMQRERQKITEAKQGDQIGITVEGKGKIKEGDVLEIYTEEQIKRQLKTKRVI